MGVFYDSLTPEQRIIHDALCDSQYLAGVAAGWNAAVIKDAAASEAALTKIRQSRDGYLSGFREARDAISTRRSQ